MMQADDQDKQLTLDVPCRLAHPIDRLRTKYDDFQHRMVHSCLLKTDSVGETLNAMFEHHSL